MHGSSQKKSEIQRSGSTWGLYTLFIKEKGVELQGRTNCGEVTRKYRRKIIKEDEGYLLRSV